MLQQNSGGQHRMMLHEMDPGKVKKMAKPRATTIWTMASGKHSQIDMTFLFNLNTWMVWSPVWLPMIFVITPPLSEYCNFRTAIFLALLTFIKWNHRYWGQFKNASWRSFLYAIFVPRLWPTRIEIHCDKCETALSSQVQMAESQEVGWKLRCIRRFPWRIFSRHWGYLAHTKLRPHFLNTIVIYFYVWLFDCKVEEALDENLSHYESLGSFFTRHIKKDSRQIEYQSDLVSPADGTTTFCGSFQGGFLQQVKGVHYSLPYFLGLKSPGQNILCGSVQEPSELLHNKNGTTALYQHVVYLGPGDYHRFHSPVEWTVDFYRHFPGELLSVKPNVVQACPGLFHLNERVSWLGSWTHGFFSMTAVGATNVGSIHMDLDPDLKTNRPYGRKSQCDVAKPCSTRNFYFSEKHFEPSLPFQKGQNFGHFSFGSTIVLIFEAPLDFQFQKVINQKVFMGQTL